jgi:hypothetical protein
MSKLSKLVLAATCAGLMAAPVFAQDKDDKGNFVIERGGQEAKPTTATKLDKVLGWETSDGKFKLKLENRVQFRFTGNNEVANGGKGSDGRDFMNFRVRRFKTTFSGHIFDKDFQYKATIAWTNSAGQLVESAVFTWAAHELLNISGGQDKTPFSWEEMTSSGRQSFVDRSVTNGYFSQGFAKGIWLGGAFKGDSAVWVKYTAGVFNGVLRGNGDFRNQDLATTSDTFKANAVNAGTGNTGSGGVDSDLMFTLRVETHPLGEVAMDMVDIRGEDKFDKPLFAVGLGLLWFGSDLLNNDFRPNATTAAASGRSQASQDTLAWTMDGHFRWHGLAVNIEFHWRHTEFHYQGRQVGKNGALLRKNLRPTNLDEMGLSADVSYFILPKTFNVGLRYSMVNGEDFEFNNVDGNALLPDATEIGLVVGYYVQGHNLKLQMDISYVDYQLATFRTGAPREPVAGLALPNRSAISRANDNADHLALWQMRLQLQWIF